MEQENRRNTEYHVGAGGYDMIVSLKRLRYYETTARGVFRTCLIFNRRR